MLRAIIDQKKLHEIPEIEAINKFFYSLLKPQNFRNDDPKNVLTDMDHSFEDVCFILESHHIYNPKKLSVFEFQKKLALLKKQVQKMKEQGGRRPKSIVR